MYPNGPAWYFPLPISAAGQPGQRRSAKSHSTRLAAKNAKVRERQPWVGNGAVVAIACVCASRKKRSRDSAIAVDLRRAFPRGKFRWSGGWKNDAAVPHRKLYGTNAQANIERFVSCASHPMEQRALPLHFARVSTITHPAIFLV
jgi:hypothetical protein